MSAEEIVKLILHSLYFHHGQAYGDPCPTSISWVNHTVSTNLVTLQLGHAMD
jgi:hypothetical protein